MSKDDLNEVYEAGVLIGKITALDELLESIRDQVRQTRDYPGQDKPFVMTQFAEASIAVLNIKADLLRAMADKLY